MSKPDPRLIKLTSLIQSVSWDFDAEQKAEKYRLAKPRCERIVYKALGAVIDHKESSYGRLAVRYSHDGIMLQVVFMDPRHPVITGVSKTSSGLQSSPPGSKKASSKRSGSRVPRSYDELKERIIAKGYQVHNAAHPKVTTQDGKLVVVLPGTASDYRSLKNVWAEFQRADRQLRSGKPR